MQWRAMAEAAGNANHPRFSFSLSTLDAGPRRLLGPELSDTDAHEAEIKWMVYFFLFFITLGLELSDSNVNGP